MGDLESKFDEFFKASGKALNNQKINISFTTSPPRALLLVMFLNDALNGRTIAYNLFNEEAKNELNSICQEIIDQVASKPKFRSDMN